MFSGSSWHHTTSALMVGRQHAAQGVDRERIHLLQPDDGDVLDVLSPPLLQQVVVDLAGADHDTANLFRRGDARRFPG